SAARLGTLSPRGVHELDAVAWSSRDELAAGGDSGHVQLWRRRHGGEHLERELLGLRSINGQPEAVQSLAFSPDGRLLAAGDVNHTPGQTPYRFGSVAVWDVASGRLLWRVRGRHGDVHAVPFSPDGRTI